MNKKPRLSPPSPPPPAPPPAPAPAPAPPVANQSPLGQLFNNNMPRNILGNILSNFSPDEISNISTLNRNTGFYVTRHIPNNKYRPQKIVELFQEMHDIKSAFIEFDRCIRSPDFFEDDEIDYVFDELSDAIDRLVELKAAFMAVLREPSYRPPAEHSTRDVSLGEAIRSIIKSISTSTKTVLLTMIKEREIVDRANILIAKLNSIRNLFP